MSESKPQADGSDEPTQVTEPNEPVASETGTASEATESLDDVFVRWFLRFNAQDPTAHPKGKPSPSSVSWMRAGEIIADAGLGAQAAAVLQRVVCWTRHMHTGSVELEPGWLASGQYEIDTERFRARPHRMTDAPQNWFAVETNEEELRRVLLWFLEVRRVGEVVGEPVGSLLSVEEMREHIGHTPPKSAQVYKDDADTMTRSDRPDAPTTGGLGEWAWQKGVSMGEEHEAERRALAAKQEAEMEASARNPMRKSIDALELGTDANCPPGYQILVTPEGQYIAAWYSPARRSEAEVVADAWKHFTQGK